MYCGIVLGVLWEGGRALIGPPPPRDTKICLSDSCMPEKFQFGKKICSNYRSFSHNNRGNITDFTQGYPFHYTG